MPTWSFTALLEASLTVAVLISTAFTILILTLPSTYGHLNVREFSDESFSEADKKDPQQSGYAYFRNHKDAEGKLTIPTTVQVVVLGDIGRSPRMQNHALSIASCGGTVQLIGYLETEVHPDIQASRFIRVVPISPSTKHLQTNSKILFLVFAPLKVLWQIWSLYYALGYRTKACEWMLIQNPPAIPTLAVAQFVCFFRKTKLVIDWHNFGYSLLAMKLGAHHPLVSLSEWYEGFFSRGANAHFAVSNAMTKVLKTKWHVEAVALHDRPPKQFQPLTKEQRLAFLYSLPETVQQAQDLESGKWKLVISPTSWTPDEDFALLLDALVLYSASFTTNDTLPKVLAIITGKGPLKDFYLSKIRQLTRENKLQNVVIKTAWLSPHAYASLLGSADLGISLHTSSSGVDLPMKVVDMFGAGLPVAGWDKFEAWSELVHEGENGRGFGSAESLGTILQDLFGRDVRQLDLLSRGALKECDRRWDDEWMSTARPLFRLKPLGSYPVSNRKIFQLTSNDDVLPSDYIEEIES